MRKIAASALMALVVPSCAHLPTTIPTSTITSTEIVKHTTIRPTTVIITKHR